MNENWKPGDVVAFGNNRAMFVEQNGDRFFISTIGTHWRDVRTARRLVVIDNEFDQTMVKHLRIAAEDNSALTTLSWLADQIEDQTRPPKPTEPLGLGAVVADATGVRWIKIDLHAGCNDWTRIGAPTHQDEQAKGESVRWRYSEIAAVRVLSEGVTP